MHGPTPRFNGLGRPLSPEPAPTEAKPFNMAQHRQEWGAKWSKLIREDTERKKREGLM